MNEYNLLLHFRLNKWIAGLSGDSTLIAFVPRHHNVTFHSPPSPPGVFDQPVVLTKVSSITNNKYSVIHPSSATGPVQKKEQILLNLFARACKTDISVSFFSPRHATLFALRACKFACFGRHQIMIYPTRCVTS